MMSYFNNKQSQLINDFMIKNPLKNKKIFISGHRGMVGSALVKYFKKKEIKKLILITKKNLIF